MQDGSGGGEAPSAADVRFERLVDRIHDVAVYALDRDGRIVGWNGRAQRLKGYAEEEILGQHFGVFYTDEDRAAGVPDALLARAASEDQVEAEGWRVRKDGTRFWANVLVTAFVDEEGRLEGFTKVTRDFSERRRQEDALRDMIHEREVLLRELQHRVKNNLQVIHSLMRMQMRRLGEGEAARALDECRGRVAAISLVHETLQDAKDYARVRMPRYVQQLTDNFALGTDLASRRITLRLDVEDVRVGVDRAIPCGLVINELLTNAIKHAFVGRDRGEVVVALQRVGEGRLCLRVGDDGVGLPPQLDATRDGKLGLSLVRALASQLKATLDIATAGPGAAFALTFDGELHVT